MRYAVIIEQAEGNCSAYVPDLPGCVTTGATFGEIEQNIRDAIELHLDGLCEDGLPIPLPSTLVEYCELAALPCSQSDAQRLRRSLPSALRRRLALC